MEFGMTMILIFITNKSEITQNCFDVPNTLLDTLEYLAMKQFDILYLALLCWTAYWLLHSANHVLLVLCLCQRPQLSPAHTLLNLVFFLSMTLLYSQYITPST